MRKKAKPWALAGVITGIASIFLFYSVALASGNAYQDFKGAALNTIKSQNYTLNAEYTLEADGKTTLSGTYLVKFADQDYYSQVKAKSAGLSEETEMSAIGGKFTYASGSEKSEWEIKRDSKQSLSAYPSLMKLFDMGTDIATGSAKNYVTYDGGVIKCSMDSAQVPEVFNAAASAFFEVAKNSGYSAFNKAINEAVSGLPEMKGASIASFSLEGTVEQNNVTSFKYTIVINGKDNNGKAHTVKYSADAKLSGFGTTKPASAAAAGIAATGQL